MSYDFLALAPEEFEDLVADVLGVVLGARLEQFKAGSDSGIDLRYALTATAKGDLIAQCKRYETGAVRRLLESLRKERKNLEVLKPSRYLVSTTVGLSPANKQKLVDLLQPWVLSPGDVFGPAELNQVLREHPEIIRAHFKLWISSTAVLEQVLHARIFAQTEATLEATRRYARRLVVHEGLNHALDILREHHHVLIAGNPGIGKTTLARMIMCRYMDESYEPVWVTDSTGDAWAMIQAASHAPQRKFLVVYDDFLGRFKFDREKLGKNEDASLMTLIDRAKSLGNLRLVLTTREYILADARRLHGALDARADEIAKYTLALSQYTDGERAKILFNHLYFSDLPNSRLRALVQSKTYKRVLANRNFNPRTVEAVCTQSNTKALTDGEFLAYFQEEFDNPASLWQRPFEQEISPLARSVLVCLWSFGGRCEYDVLQEATLSLAGPAMLPEFDLQYRDAMKMLDGNFIATNMLPDETRGQRHHVVTFQNPSVEEFVASQASSHWWLQQVAQSVVDTSQLTAVIDTLEEAPNPQAWQALRARAPSCTSRGAGSVLNFQAWSESHATRTWMRNIPAPAETLLVLLRIERGAGMKDARTLELVEPLFSSDTWSELLLPVTKNGENASSVARLQSSIWSWLPEAAERSEAAFRHALLLMMRQEHAYSLPCFALRVLWSAAAQAKPQLGSDEAAAIVAVVEATVETALYNDWDESSLVDESVALLAMGRQFGIRQLRALGDQLREAADKQERKQTVEGPDPVTRTPPAKPGIDVDRLFQGLLDR